MGTIAEERRPRPAVPAPSPRTGEYAWRPRLIDRTDVEYKHLRRQVFVAIFIGYAAYYLVRMNFSLAIPDILREFPQYTKASSAPP